MKTIIDVAIEVIKEKCANYEYIEFKEIFDIVESELKDLWLEKAEKQGIDYKDILELKMGELYKIMTLDSRFVRNEEGLWTKKRGFE
ncbi:MAG: DNA-directed RNA polymerase subunit delta [Metamycoplasmataceae bacterium]|uniref:DNA-directed RNA polymerase subunit delta n=1 Tax=Mycoplasmopsis lipophila TaxID=2117 RepID=UPI0038739752